ncbi:disintegrin and metalloproteinase domain-containing protein 32-like isoform X1 [Oryctolagus cuniculus]|uniref:disintegrin and metalloproteinase domain-containing protein 32-like isoform X1 n=2 Tax=Oryctolagus cuniculus TaxID=9986 RepID=UPI000491B25D
MLRLLLLLAGLRGCPAPRPGFQNSFLQIISPEKIQANTSGNSEEHISYIIPIDEKLYTAHLKQRYFLADNFMVYLYNQGSVKSHSSGIQPQCYYQGYIEGYANSIVTLSTCSGLRGILQFENVSYGIEPLESTVKFQHLLYKLGEKSKEFSSFNSDTKSERKYPLDYHIYIDEKLKPSVPDMFPLYLEIYIVVDKALYEYLGSDSMIVTNKVIEVIGLVNSMFTRFKVTVVLSLLDLWSDENKISTAGEADELLHIFLNWKNSHLTFRPYDVVYLFIYKDYPDYVGAVFPGKICATGYSAGIAVYPKEMTLEAFSVVVSQMLALSLGISYDDPKKCHCSEANCIMNQRAMTSSGVKTFSSCSLIDFQSFISNEGASCLQNKPQIQRQAKAVCGNGITEGSEICDCGTVQECGPDNCCDPRTCRPKVNIQCFEGECCLQCRIRRDNHLCRASRNRECDIPEYCNGQTADCPRDITIHNGQLCNGGRLMCYDGDCPDLDQRCESLFGRGSKNAPFSCYEEIQSQRDRFGNCGHSIYGYVRCPYRSLVCGRLICTYPPRSLFRQTNGAVIFAKVRDKICVTIDYRLPKNDPDPLVIKSGSICDAGRICVNQACVEAKILRNQSRTCAQQCNGNGVCTSTGVCHCSPGFQPPNCQRHNRALPLLPEKKDLKEEITPKIAENHWNLSFFIGFPILIVATAIIVAWDKLKRRPAKEDESLSIKSKSEDNTQAETSSN